MNKASTCYTIYWDDTLIGFRSVLPMPSGTSKYSYRGNRLVILPDYQNLGFGTQVNEFIGEHYLSKGLKYFIRSSHLRLKTHCNSSALWTATSSSGKVTNKPATPSSINFGAKDREMNRIAYSFEYMGKDYATKPHITMHVDNNPNINYDIMEQDLIYLKEKYWLCVVTGEINTPSKIEDICRELGIRTQLLYYTRKGVSNIARKYKREKIITVWDEAFSQKVRRYYIKGEQ